MYRILLVVLALMAASVFAVDMIQQDMRRPATRATSKQAPRRPADARIVVIRPSNGHFATDARVEGREVSFMVDTGATYITMRESDAARLGYRPYEREYVVRITTANGEGRAAPIELSRVEVGEITVRDVPALVVHDDALSVNLLGMSFLSRVRWTHERGQLVLEQ